MVSEEKMFENIDTHTHTYIHTADRAYLYYKLTNEPKGSGELKSLRRSLACTQSSNEYIAFESPGDAIFEVYKTAIFVPFVPSIKRRHGSTNVFICQCNIRLTSSHDDGCLTVWPNKSVNKCSAPRIWHNYHRTFTVNIQK